MSTIAPSLTASQSAALDDPATWGVHTRWLNDAPAAGASSEAAGSAVPRRAQTRLRISGIHCAACSGLIETALMRVPGVLHAEVSAAAERAIVEWQPDRLRPSQLIEAVRHAGYGAFPDSGAQALDEAQRANRAALWRLFVAAFCMMQVMMYAAPAYMSSLSDMGADVARLLRWASWLLSIPVMLFAARPLLGGAWRALRQRRLGMDVPVALGIVVTFVASSAAAFNEAADSEIYFDSLTMFVTVLLAARWLEGQARRRAASSLDALMHKLPDAVERLDAQDQVTLVSAQTLAIGDRVRVPVGQAYAADGVLLSGPTAADESMLTGESRPVPKAVGASVQAGCLNLGAPVVMRVMALGAITRYQRIVELVERTLTQRPASLLTADRWAAPFLWAVLALAALAYLAWQWIDPSRALWVAVSVLIVTCPCALSIGAPVAYLAAAGQLARKGILLQRLDALEALSRTHDVVFDKTGTLTEDQLALADPHAQQQHLQIAAGLAAHSSHPLSRAIVRAAEAAAPTAPVGASDSARPVWSDVQELPGRGLAGLLTWGGPAGEGAEPRRWRLGLADWAAASQPGTSTVDGPVASGRPTVDFTAEAPPYTSVRFEFDERLREDAGAAVAALQAAGVRSHVLSGDHAASVSALAQQLGLSSWHAGCSPEDKLRTLTALQAAGDPVVMVGDGINDAPVLARADVSVAMGSAAAMAQAHADVIILANRLLDVALLRRTAVRTMHIVHQNLGWALAYNLACVPLALVGWLPPWAAGLGMAGSSLLVVLNALRLARA